MRMASANLQCVAEFARSLELNALSLSHLTFITTTIRTFHICWIALLSRVSQEYLLLISKSTGGIALLTREAWIHVVVATSDAMQA
jgi:hypothetical protein